jgi:hypothetical protein
VRVREPRDLARPLRCGEADEQQRTIAEPGEGIRDRPGASSRQYHYVLFTEVSNGQDG